jgi:hypothetical protein
MNCCADCGVVAGGAVSLKACKACMNAKYCSAACQRNHWSTHKKSCKERAAEIHDEALFKVPSSAKEDCPICSRPMPLNLISSLSLPPATILSVPIYDYATAHRELSVELNEMLYYSCCGKRICKGCVHSFRKSGNDNCPFATPTELAKQMNMSLKN